MDDVIQPAMTLVQEELNKQGTISHISDAVEDRIRLEVDLGNELNFIYEVRLRGYSSPTFALAAMDNNEQQTEQHRYYRAEVYLKEGGQNYDVMGWNRRKQPINDILDQYENICTSCTSFVNSNMPSWGGNYLSRPQYEECRMISRWKWILKQTVKKLWFRATLFAIVAIITALLSILLNQ